jgi:transcriptional regulator with XRE-family HTH domain
LHGFFVLGRKEAVMENKLRVIRRTKEVTQFDLRLKTGIHPSRVSLIEHGYIEPREDEKRRLAKALGVMPEEIFPEGQRLVA